MTEIIAVLSAWVGVLKMLLFEELTTLRARIASVLLFVWLFCVTAWLVNWVLLSVRAGWF